VQQNFRVDLIPARMNVHSAIAMPPVINLSAYKFVPLGQLP
jgi:hypothetical protein